MTVADQLQEALAHVAADHDRVLVNLEACEFIDSTGIAVIVKARQSLAEEGRQVLVCAPSAQVRRVMEVTGLLGNRRHLVFESSDEALAD
jgi:anti-sigma B factor antagonist